jgi:transcriptional regulator with XRE-family HTH domain
MRINLLVARKKTGLTQREVAENAGITLDRYSNIETGRQLNVDVTLAAKIKSAVRSDDDSIFLIDNSYKMRKNTIKKKGA